MSVTPAIERIRGFVAITRPLNAIVAGVLTFTGAFVGSESFWSLQAGAAVAATILAVAAGNAINDYFDRDIDRVNAPDRPIPSGTVSPREAIRFATVLFAVAIGVALTLPLPAIAVALVNLVALVTYTSLFKGRPAVGNAVVAYLGGSTFLFGALAVGALGPALVLAVLAALSTFAREVVKDVEDVSGDAAEGLATLPIAIGARPALLLGSALLGIAIVVSPLPYLQGTFGPAYLVLVVPANLLMAYAALASFTDPTRGQRFLKYGMFLAAAAFVVGRVAVL